MLGRVPIWEDGGFAEGVRMVDGAMGVGRAGGGTSECMDPGERMLQGCYWG